MKVISFILTLFTTCSVSAQQIATTAKINSDEITVPFAILQDFGHRPAVEGFVNGFPIKFEIHSNAGFSMQLSHEAADQGKIMNRTHVDKFGIVSVGKVSDLGRDSAFVNELTIKGKAFKQVPVSIFETPSQFDVGMLGLRWLTTNRVVVNYHKQEIVINSLKGAATLRHQNLLQEGYLAIPMKRDTSDGRYLVKITANGVTRPIVVSTVSSNTFDSEFADAAHIKYTGNGRKFGGPSGSTGNVYQVEKPVKVKINNHSFIIKDIIVNDDYAYMAKKRPADPSQNRAGMLAADFLIAYNAVVDFANSILYLKIK